MNMLELANVNIAYNETNVVEDFSWELKAGEIGCLLGSSGSGKSTLLKSIAGFKEIKSGEIRIRGQLMSANNTSLAPESRHIGMMFQDLALFPHLNVAQNIAFGLKHADTQTKHKRVSELLALVDLQNLEKRGIHELSGGQQQRVALARALAPKPDLLLFDEPFSSLDKDLRESLALQIREILKHEKITGLLVTHDHGEAFVMADELAILNQGTLQQSGAPYELYHRPQSQYVAKFLGVSDFITGNVNAQREVVTSLGNFALPPDWQGACDGSLQVLVRPDDIIHCDTSKMRATIIKRQFKGAQFLFTLQYQGEQIHCYASAHHNHQPGEEIGIELDMQHCIAFQG